ncbi:MAG: hypothetical protein AAF215_03465 [Cyanobacteria bacterium P01_A01_bin.123]
MAEQRWVFVVRALDKPGTLTAVAAVFSNRGVSLESILGSGIAMTTIENGRLILRFSATEAKQTLLRRALERLSSVSRVKVYPYEDERLRAIAVAKLTSGANLSELAATVDYDAIAQGETHKIVLFSGKTIAVDTAIAKLRQTHQLEDVVMSSITV